VTLRCSSQVLAEHPAWTRLSHSRAVISSCSPAACRRKKGPAQGGAEVDVRTNHEGFAALRPGGMERWSSQGLPSSGAGLGCCFVIRPGGKSYRCALSAALPHVCVARRRKAPARTPIAAAATMEPVRCRRANLRKPVTASPRS
jgi:hypothetical protein